MSNAENPLYDCKKKLYTTSTLRVASINGRIFEYVRLCYSDIKNPYLLAQYALNGTTIALIIGITL